MNLIEQLGGYANAKFLISAMTEGASMEFNGVLSNREQLCEVLLEYRRQHNIYEVGDKVVSKYENLNLFGDVVLEIEYFRKLSSVVWVRFTNENDYRVDALRHATDAEIKAGKRLGVNDGN